MLLPLQGVKVLDLSRLLPGPFASQVMVDFGADVLKVEDLGAGDYLRDLPPRAQGRGVRFHTINRGKKSIGLDLKTDGGQEVFRRLVQDADVLLEGFRPGVMERLGLGYTELKTINPRLIYCSLTGYGHSGPYRDLAGHDINYLSYAGVLSLTGESGRNPVIPGIQIADIGGGGMWAVIAILLALRARDLTGEGQFCDVSMLDGAFAFSVFALGQTALTGESSRRGQELLSGGYACYNVYQTADGGYVSLGAVEYKFWEQFCNLIGREDYIPLHMIETAQSRIKKELGTMFATRTREQWIDAFSGFDFCFSPVLDYKEALNNEQLLAREMVVQGSYGGLDTVAPGVAVKLSSTPGQVRDEVPGSGQHTREILTSLGYTIEQIDSLIEQKAVARQVDQAVPTQ